ncbi:MAG: anhydro-N-acetylmuramic acid kinase [Flavobacteriales bacterium]|nr:anhydro-N-acetylmuramic acid kinase [Flavobacteriales bacterium]
MSGTSLDGMDLCYVEFTFDGKWQFEIVASDCVTYDDKWSFGLRNAHTFTAEKLGALGKDFGRFTGGQVNIFLEKFGLAKPDLVCSHGHTVFHEPAKKFTLQIGDGQEIANACGLTTVSDFRSLDVSLGGQGAPLVPIGDELLFTNYEACLNLGGFSNISFKEGGERRAFDICPVNIAFNPLANSLGKPFDESGAIARAGKLNETLLAELNSLLVYTEGVRPSLAREWLENEFNPVVEKKSVSIENKLRTVTEHAAWQISMVINAKAMGGLVLVTGGGAKNRFLMERLAALSKAEIVVPKSEIVDFKEALIFAFLGVLRMRSEINVLRSVTGASCDSSSGVVHFPTS